MPVASQSHGLTGQCDVVELHYTADRPVRQSVPDRIVPIEYKRGKPKGHRADEVQLCAQTLCLEEMFGVPINIGHLFYGRIQRRVEVSFDSALRQLTIGTAEAIRTCIQSGTTPTADYAASKCDRCSMIDICQPRASRFRRGTASWFKLCLESSLENA
jgi:CRISPR-associated exonuclease Cas4